MALARAILVWLPLESLRRGGLLTEELVRERLAVINDLSPADFDTFRQAFGFPLDVADSYIRLCTYQGELSASDLIYLQPLDLLHRAIVVGSLADALRLLILTPRRKLSDSPAAFQAGLEAGQPLLQALALLRSYWPVLKPEESRVIFKFDPEAVPWTPGLRRFYRETIGRASGINWSRDMARVAGYLQMGRPVQLQTDSLRAYEQYYVLAELERYPAGADVPLLDMTEFRQAAMMLGYMPTGFTNANFFLGPALAHIRPGLVRRILQREPDWSRIFPLDNPLILAQIISKAVVARAQEMLQLLAGLSLAAHPHVQAYLLYLRTLCGLPISASELSALSPEKLFLLQKTMFVVSHPDTPSWLPGLDERFSLVQYAPLELVRKLPAASQQEIVTWPLVSRGQFYWAWQDENLSKAVRDLRFNSYRWTMRPEVLITDEVTTAELVLYRQKYNLARLPISEHNLPLSVSELQKLIPILPRGLYNTDGLEERAQEFGQMLWQLAQLLAT